MQTVITRSWDTLGPWGRTLLCCAAAEALAWGLLAELTGSAPAGLAISAGLLGPASVWLAPLLLRRFRRAAGADQAPAPSAGDAPA